LGTWDWGYGSGYDRGVVSKKIFMTNDFGLGIKHGMLKFVLVLEKVEFDGHYPSSLGSGLLFTGMVYSFL
jgi:hypothetical protein